LIDGNPPYDGTALRNAGLAWQANLNLMEGKALENIYDTYRTLDGEQITTADRDRLKQSIQEQKSAWFATHPTITERFRAIEPFSDIPPAEPQSAIELFDNVPSLEKRLTDYLTGHAANSTVE
jgi:Zn-dependent protease with chaperone function